MMSTYPNSALSHLRTILELEEQGIEAIRARLAERLGHSMPSTCQATSKLEQLGLATLDRVRRSVTLTPAGRRAAVDTLRKHRLAETFLAEAAGLDWTLLHAEASRWEQTMSDQLAAAIDAQLGSPGVTPYGTSIPPAGATDWRADSLEHRSACSLDELEPPHGEHEFILHAIGEIAQSTPGLLLELDRAGLRPGSVVTITATPESIELRPAASTEGISLCFAAAAGIRVQALRQAVRL